MKNSFFLKEGRFQFYQQVFSFCLLNPRVWYCKQQYSTLMMYPPWSKRNNVNKILENFTENKSYKLNRIDLKMNLDDRNQGCLLHTGTCRLLWLFHGLQQISCSIDEMLQLELTTAISLPFYYFFQFINSHYISPALLQQAILLSKVVITTVAGLSCGDIVSLCPTWNQWLLRVIISTEPWQTPVPSDKSTHIIITEGEVREVFLVLSS